ISGTENPMTIVVTGNMSIRSLFAKESPTLTAAMEGSPQDGNLPLLSRLESPSPGKAVSGINALYGWALDGDGISKVELFIDGNYVCDIPHGGQRGDIKEAYPEYPDSEESGFAMVMNYASLSPGKHLVQVRVHNSREETSVLGAEVFVNSFHGEMVSQASPNEWVIPGVQMTADGVTKAYDLKLEWSNESQGFEISDIVEK
ncbi:MAG: Ig-like domain-containing protein, partial [Methanomicrobiales archaeon]|nr:Ig-like domain-containing protein [Methanomicrobiales archaeon]